MEVEKDIKCNVFNILGMKKIIIIIIFDNLRMKTEHHINFKVENNIFSLFFSSPYFIVHVEHDK